VLDCRSSSVRFSSAGSFGESVTLAFEAKFVSCADAIGGEILQVCFDTMPASDDENARTTPYVLISRNFEFPGPAAIEWHSGDDYDGGAEIISAILTRDRILIKLDRDLELDVGFRVSDRQFASLTSYLRTMVGAGVFVAK
jgi:hypothetical protein